MDILPGKSVTFSAVIRGTPPFKVRWFRGVNELVPSDKCNIYLEDSVTDLELFDVEPQQSGEYTCVVTNEAGKVSCTAHLSVKGWYRLHFFALECLGVCAALMPILDFLLLTRTSRFCEEAQ